MSDKYHLHFVSNATGETIHSVARACLSQSDVIEAEEHHWSLVPPVGQIERVLANIKENPGVDMFTIVNEDIRHRLQSGCRALKLPCIPELDPVIATLADFLGIESNGKARRQQFLNAQYFERIDAMTYAMVNDDGQTVSNLGSADLVLVEVSRTSKTPKCMYLANRGIKAANVPYVPNMPLPTELFDLPDTNPPLVVGLTNSPERLIQLRRNRLRSLAQDDETGYAHPEIVHGEVAAARRLFTEQGWPIVDVTRRSIEETADAIMQLLVKT